MKNKLVHFAAHTDDIDRAKQFYTAVFDWEFKTFGPPDFLQIQAGDGQVIGALQSRSYSSVPDKMIGLECTFNVENIDDIIDRVTGSGGTILMPKTAIPYVGWLSKFLDTEGNLICAMQYDQSAR